MQVRPFMIAPELPARIGRRLRRIALEPAVNVIVIALLPPYQSGESLALHESRVVADSFRRSLAVEFIGFLFAFVKPRFKSRSEIIFRRQKRIARIAIHQPQSNRPTFPRWNIRREMPGGFRSLHLGIHSPALALDYITMKGVLHEGRPALCLIEPLHIRFVIGKE